MRQEFLSIIGEEEFRITGGLRLESAASNGNGLKLRLFVEPYEDAPAQEWSVEVAQSFSERLSLAWVDVVAIEQRHPVLLPFKEEDCDIYFSKNKMPPAKLLGIVLASVVEHVGEWHSLSRFVNAGLGLGKLHCPAEGLLGRFPRSVVGSVAKAVLAEPIELQVINPRPPVYWDGGQYVAYPADLEAFVFGDSFVVGSGFEFKRA